MAAKRLAFGKNTKVEKLHLKDLEHFAGKTVGMVLNGDACLQLAENLIRAARAGTGSQPVDLTLFLKQRVLTVTAVPKSAHS